MRVIQKSKIDYSTKNTLGPFLFKHLVFVIVFIFIKIKSTKHLT